MAGSVKESGYREIVLRRGEDRSIKFIYRPRDRSLPPFDISGQTVVLKVKAKGAAEQTFGSPEVAITNGPGGEITLNGTGSTLTTLQFQSADYAILLNGKRLVYGSLTLTSLYE